MKKFSILLMVFIAIEKIYVDAETLFLRRTNTTRWKLYEILHGSHILQCTLWCFQSGRCKSFSMEPLSLASCLYGNGSTALQSPMTETNNTLAREKTSWGPCSNYQCDEVGITSRYCPLPAVILNANTSSGLELEGSEMTYTCNHGYLDTSRDTLTDNTTCLTNKTWSPVSLNCTGPYIRLEIPYTTDYTWTPLTDETLKTITGNTSSLVFLVKTCQNSNIHLYTAQNTDIEVAIGGWDNTKSIIKTFNTPGYAWNSFEKNGLVSCEKFHPFWLTWEHGIVSVGTGSKVKEQRFMNWKSPTSINVKRVDISSYKRNSGGRFF